MVGQRSWPVLVLMVLVFAGLAAQQKSELRYRAEKQRAARWPQPVVHWLWGEGDRAHPRAVVMREQVRFLDEQGAVRNQVELPAGSSAVMDAGGRLLGIVHTTGAPDRPLTSVQVYDAEGRQLGAYSAEGTPAEPFPAVTLVVGGGVVLAWTAEARLEFCHGGWRRTLQLFPGSPCQERPLAIAADATGRCVAVATQRCSSSSPGAAPGEPAILTLFSVRGDERWRRRLAGQTAASVALAPEGDLVVAASYSWDDAYSELARFTEVFDSLGRRRATFPLLTRMVSFSSDRRRLLLAEKRSLALVDLEDASVLWRWEEPTAVRFLAALVATPSLDTCAVLSARARPGDRDFVLFDVEVAVLGRSGLLLDRQAFPGQEVLVPALHASRDLRTIVVGLATHCIVLRATNE